MTLTCCNGSRFSSAEFPGKVRGMDPRVKPEDNEKHRQLGSFQSGETHFFRHLNPTQSERRKRHAVQPRHRPMRFDGRAMAGGGIAHMNLEAVAVVVAAAAAHHAVAHHLGDDRGGGDRLRALVGLPIQAKLALADGRDASPPSLP